jgi:hypothetical protein
MSGGKSKAKAQAKARAKGRPAKGTSTIPFKAISSVLKARSREAKRKIVEPSLAETGLADPSIISDPYEEIPAPWEAADESASACTGKFAIQGGLSIEDTIRCGTCNEEAFEGKFQLRGKRSGRWKCGKCTVKLVQLHRIFGGWPTKEFKGFEETAQFNFMQKIKECKSQADVKAICEKTWTKMRVEGKERTVSAEALPLSVWAARGFDAAKIEAEAQPHDIEERRMLGTCYRVPIDTRADYSRQEEARSERMKTVQQEARKDPKKRKRDASSSSDGSDSSSSDKKDKKDKKNKKDNKEKTDKNHKKDKQDKKDKNHKKDPAEEKAAEAERVRARKAAEREEKASIAKTKSECRKILGRFSPVLFTMDTMLEDKAHKLIPSFQLKPLSECHKKCHKVLDMAKKKSMEDAPTPTADTLEELWQMAKDAEALVKEAQPFLVAARKHLAG